MAPRSDKKPTGDDDKVVIKKYANRRLYNTRTSSYIVLNDVIELINSGTEFVIEDAKTGQDITRSILNQIIFEHETGANTFLFPLEFQKQLIRLYNDTYGKMLPDFLTQSMKLFTAERGEWQDNLSNMMNQNTETLMKQSEAMARQNMELFRKTWDIFGVMGGAQSEEKTDSAPEASAPSKAEENDERSAELEDLQEQIDKLQSQLKSMK